jgi:hypothetical protein
LNFKEQQSLASHSEAGSAVVDVKTANKSTQQKVTVEDFLAVDKQQPQTANVIKSEQASKTHIAVNNKTRALTTTSKGFIFVFGVEIFVVFINILFLFDKNNKNKNIESYDSNTQKKPFQANEKKQEGGSLNSIAKPNKDTAGANSGPNKNITLDMKLISLVGELELEPDTLGEYK